VSLGAVRPRRLNQGQQGSCVAWASAYAARTIVQSEATRQEPNSTAFSPSFLYNQIKLDNRRLPGLLHLQGHGEHVRKSGVLPISQFGYTDQSCSKSSPRPAERNRPPVPHQGLPTPQLTTPTTSAPTCSP
jgi:hypothetical protein